MKEDEMLDAETVRLKADARRERTGSAGGRICRNDNGALYGRIIPPAGRAGTIFRTIMREAASIAGVRMD
jgi:hypothetical protein